MLSRWDFGTLPICRSDAQCVSSMPAVVGLYGSTSTLGFDLFENDTHNTTRQTSTNFVQRRGICSITCEAFQGAGGDTIQTISKSSMNDKQPVRSEVRSPIIRCT